MHPSNYPEAVDLPFNFSSVKNGFELHTPDRATDEKEGIWVIIQGGSVVLEQRHDSLELLKGKRPALAGPGAAGPVHRHLAGPAALRHDRQQQPGNRSPTGG